MTKSVLPRKWGIEMERVQLVCQKCGKGFSLLPCQMKRDRGKFCSKACYHSARYKGSDYKKIGFKRADRIKAESVLGKPIPEKVVLHHFKGKRGPFVICEDQSYHAFLHQRQRSLDATGNPNKRKCVICKGWDLSDNLYINTDHNNVIHNECRNIYQASRR